MGSPTNKMIFKVTYFPLCLFRNHFIVKSINITLKVTYSLYRLLSLALRIRPVERLPLDLTVISH